MTGGHGKAEGPPALYEILEGIKEMVINFDGHMSIGDVVSVARDHVPVKVAPAVLDAISRAHVVAQELSKRIPTYGRTTGVGANRTVDVDHADQEHGLRLLRSHAIDAGDPLPAATVRAMLAVRLSQLSVPGSGIRPDVLPALAKMLNADALPQVLEFGSVGTADLAGLAAVALALMGERPTSSPLPPMQPWGSDSALPFMSSGSLTLGRACLVLKDLRDLLDASAAVFSLGFVGLRGNRSPFSVAAADAGATPRLSEVCEVLRQYLGTRGESARIQDPYALRAFATTLAPVYDALDQLDQLVSRLINTAQENPLFIDSEVVHHAGFHQAALGLKADALAMALAAQTPLAVSRIRLMSEPDFTGLRPFLASETVGASGIMMVEYVAGAAVGELYACAHPSSLTTVVLSRGIEEDASFAPVAIGQLERAVRAEKVLIASELLISTRMLNQQGVKLSDLPSDVLRRVWNIVAALPSGDEDRDLREDLIIAQQLLTPLASVGR